MRPLRGHDAVQVGACPEDLDAVDAPPDLAQIVVDEANGLKLVIFIVPHVSGDHFSRVARAVDEHTLLTVEPRELSVDTPSHPHATEQENQENAVDQQHRAWIASDSEDPMD